MSGLTLRAPTSLRNSAAYGVLWGLAVWVLEATAYAFTRADLLSTWPLLVTLACIWITRGVALAWAAAWLAERVLPVLAWLAFPAIAILLSLTWDGFAAAVVVSRALFRVELPESGQFLFTLWGMLVYGSPLFAFCQIDTRARRTRDLLALAEVARMQGAAAVDAARYELLTRRIDPLLLRRVLETVRQRIKNADGDASVLLDALVEFLRASMPGVRRGSSTLALELVLANSHGRLQQMLDGGRGWIMPADECTSSFIQGESDEQRSNR